MHTSSNCIECNHPNAIDQHYCGKCGTSLTSSRKKSVSGKLIFAALLVLFISPVYWLALTLLSSVYSWTIYENLFYLNKLVSLGAMAVPFLLYAAIQDKKYKVRALVFAILITLISMYWFISDLIRHFSMSDDFLQF